MLAFASISALALTLRAAELHVSIHGNDACQGTSSVPLRTIQRAADLAQPGDTITVHAGVYRERINPPRGGTSNRKRITYQAARGEQVEIKGSAVVKGWFNKQADVWQATLPNSFFGNFNPYTNLLQGDWFSSKERSHHTGAVYLNGHWLTEAAQFADVLKPVGDNPLWFAKVDATNTLIWAQFKDVNPNEQLVEINVRQTVFYPDQPGRNFITVRGFALRHAATPWAPPTAEQIGLIGTHWSKGWIIENNLISHSVCSGIALGKHGDEFDNTSANAKGYVKTIERAHAHPIPWTRENIGHHIVRDNTISHCEQTGIVGSMGCAFSTVTGNVIYDIHVRRLFSGSEMAGIKFHGAIDATIRNNHIYRAFIGLWLDWMTQGARVSQNLFHDNAYMDLLLEVNHGPFVVDNNLLLSPVNLLDMSEGGAYVHNLFAGKITNQPVPTRDTPYHPAHSTAVAGLAMTTGGDNRFLNNLFVGDGNVPTAEERVALPGPRGQKTSHGLWGYDGRGFPLLTGGNVFYHGALPDAKETNSLIRSDFNPAVRLTADRGSVSLRLTPGPAVRQAPTRLVTTKRLGTAKIPELPYVNPDGSELRIDIDYFGRKRSRSKPTVGPFEKPGDDPLTLTVWPTPTVRSLEIP
jgi:alpha-N-arabinofuranosidase